MFLLLVLAILAIIGEGTTCSDRRLPSGAPVSSCLEFQAQGLCETSQKAEWFCPKTCDRCDVKKQGDQCSYEGKNYSHGFQACYDECHKDCKGKRWICWHGHWYDKGPCGSKNGDACFGNEGRQYEDGYHACFDKCYPTCDGNRWICHHGEWLPRGQCNNKSDPSMDDNSFEWSVFRENSYIRLSSMPQLDMKDACNAVGGTPVKIKDEAENNFVRQLCSFYSPCWIGLAEPPHSEEWLWMDGSTPQFVHWHKGEPNNWGHVDENAAIMSYPPGSRNGDWFDAPSSWERPVAICERPVFSTPGAQMAKATDGGQGIRVNPLVWMLLGAVLALILVKCASVRHRYGRGKQFSAERADEAVE